MRDHFGHKYQMNSESDAAIVSETERQLNKHRKEGLFKYNGVPTEQSEYGTEDNHIKIAKSLIIPPAFAHGAVVCTLPTGSAAPLVLPN
jgi:hypothetical protein